MVNFGLNSASILGLFLAIAGASLYFLRTVRPELSRDHDIFFAAVGLLCGLILLFQGWRLDPILQFGQFLLSGSVIFFGVETIRLRGATVERAKRDTPIVDDERPVSRTRVYRADLEQLEPYDDEEEFDDRRNNPILEGYPKQRQPRRGGYGYETEEPRSPKSSRNTRQRRPRTSSAPRNDRDRYDEWTETPDHWSERPTPRRKPRRESDNSYPQTSSRLKKRPRSRPSNDLGVPSVRESEATRVDYVDYQPVDNFEADNRDNRDRDWDKTQNTLPKPKPETKQDWYDNDDDEDLDYPVGSEY